MPTASQGAITRNNVLPSIDTSVCYRITEPEKAVYRILDVGSAISATFAGMVRAKIGKMDLDEVQANQTTLINTVKKLVEGAQDHWGIEVTRAEILAVNLDAATRANMMKQLNAHVLHR